MADFIHSDLRNRRKGDVLEVTLSAKANVRLLDSSNFQRYRRGERHKSYGGLAKRSTTRIEIPRSGHWHAVVDMQGLRGRVRAGFRVIDRDMLRPLPPIRERRSPIADVAENFAASADPAEIEQRTFDVFISHATEDKNEVVRPLALALRDRGLEVWYDEFELRVGDSLRRKIDSGIAGSRFGLVVFSPAFFAKHWAQHELDGIVTLSVSGKQVLLPIWHKISKDEVMSQSPSLADKVALRTSDYSIAEIADEIADVVGGTGNGPMEDAG